MKIEAITLREVQMPLVHFFETSFGRIYSRRILLITWTLTGFEVGVSASPRKTRFTASEWTDTAWPTITQHLAKPLLGKTLTQGREAVALLTRIRGHRMAKAALENALWDVRRERRNNHLWKLLGGTRREIGCGVSIGIQDSHEQLIDKIETELAAGYRRIKLKVKPGWDVNVLEKVRSRWSGHHF